MRNTTTSLTTIIYIAVCVAFVAALSACSEAQPAKRAQTPEQSISQHGLSDLMKAGPDLAKRDKEHLLKLHAAAKKYGKEHNGQWPPLHNEAGHLMFPIKGMYPDYITDPRLLVNPANHQAAQKVANLPASDKNLDAYWHNGSYWYLGYAMTNEKEGLAFIKAYKKALESGHVPTGPVKVAPGDGDGGGDTIYPLREGVTQQFIQNINNPAATSVSQADIPVMISRPVDGGGNVLFMDGHVEFMKYPGKFPMTPAFISALQSLDQLRPTAK